MATLEGRVIIVTGAARGLGRTYAERLAADGAQVVAGDVRDCDETVTAITAAGGKAPAARRGRRPTRVRWRAPEAAGAKSTRAN